MSYAVPKNDIYRAFESKFAVLSNDLTIKTRMKKITRVNSLMFNGVKQLPNSDLKLVSFDVGTTKIELEISNQDVIEVKILNISKCNSKQDAITPVVVTFKSKDLASEVLKKSQN